MQTLGMGQCELTGNLRCDDVTSVAVCPPPPSLSLNERNSPKTYQVLLRLIQHYLVKKREEVPSTLEQSMLGEGEGAIYRSSRGDCTLYETATAKQ